jgi:hypothetical protein
MEAFAGTLLVHVPPAGLLLNVVIEPWHTTSVPVTAVGAWFTVTEVVTLQPEPNV